MSVSSPHSPGQEPLSSGRPDLAARKYTQLLQLGQIIASEMDMDFLLDELIIRTNTILGTERSSLFLHDPKTQQLYSLVGTGLQAEGIRMASDQGVVGWAFQQQTPVVVNDAYQDSRFFPDVDKDLQFQTKNLICIPLVNRTQECIGVLEALNKEQGGFTEEDIHFLTHISNYATLVIEYLNLHQEQQFIKTVKERIVNHLSHELKTPLAIIANVIEFISRENCSRNAVNGSRRPFFAVRGIFRNSLTCRKKSRTSSIKGVSRKKVNCSTSFKTPSTLSRTARKNPSLNSVKSSIGL